MHRITRASDCRLSTYLDTCKVRLSGKKPCCRQVVAWLEVSDDGMHALERIGSH